jgi:hypothetical protein
MIAALWRALPGNRMVRALLVLILLAVLVLILLAVLVLVCFAWVFPAVAPLMPFNDGTVG